MDRETGQRVLFPAPDPKTAHQSEGADLAEDSRFLLVYEKGTKSVALAVSVRVVLLSYPATMGSSTASAVEEPAVRGCQR